jgi:hypothetical protein
MKKKKFRHIHRYAFRDIGNTPWVEDWIFDLLTEPAKETVRKQGYVMPTLVPIKYRTWQLKILRKLNIGGQRDPRIFIKRKEDRGITDMGQLPPHVIKRRAPWKTGRWKK